MADQDKGEEGKDTGSMVRAAIRRAITRGQTLESIGAATDRTGGTIGAILRGEIDNPPSGLAKKIMAMPAVKVKKAM